MDGVGTPIIGRPRPLPSHDTPNPAHNTYTLKCEEPNFNDMVSNREIGKGELPATFGVLCLVSVGDGCRRCQLCWCWHVRMWTGS